MWGVTAVVGAALGVVMLRAGLALVPQRGVIVEVVEILRRLMGLSTVEGNGCWSVRDSDGRVGIGLGIERGRSLRARVSGWCEWGAGEGEGT